MCTLSKKKEFRENLVDDEVPEHRDSHASSSHEMSLEPTSTRSEDLGKRRVFSHFPKDRNCEICQRTKITRAPCRRRNGGAVPRAENFGDLITADHKVLSENCESRNNHRYAIVVQDLATQWIQSYPCKTTTSQETQRNLQKFLASPYPFSGASRTRLLAHTGASPAGRAWRAHIVIFFGLFSTSEEKEIDHGAKTNLTSLLSTTTLCSNRLRDGRRS